MYAAEAVNWSRKDIQSMSFVYDQAFHKVFRSFDKKVILTCQFFMNVLPFEKLLDVRRLNFLYNSNNRVGFDWGGREIESIKNKYHFVSRRNGLVNWKESMWHVLKTEVDNISWS